MKMFPLLMLGTHFFTQTSACGSHYNYPFQIPPSHHIRRTEPAALSNFAIEDVRVFNGTHMTPPQTVLVSNEHIVSISHITSTYLPDTTKTINGTSRFIIPGLIESHVHLNTVQDLETITSYGVTTTVTF
ncbi:unnamed protein product [Periconia digitata]|uniref:Amidohydrolase-related domain-containing protein n=1 Tax=Periconia digitata TaxID=1303443 RepID=A0A9W4UIG0_9PLEO|nr:unnamed protein product [Periconia digitata]